MPIDTEHRLIRDIKFITTTHQAMHGTVLWWNICNLLAPAVVAFRRMSTPEKAKMLDSLQKIIDNPETISMETAGDLIGAFGPAITEIFSNADTSKLPGLFQSLFRNTIAIRGGVKYELGQSQQSIDNAFDGDQGALYITAFWVAAFNFASFRSGRRASNGVQAAADSSTSPT